MASRWRAACAARDRGFTLVEVLIVVIVLGILAAVAVPMFLNQRRKARDAAAKSDLHNIAIAYESWTASDPVAPMAASTTVADVSAALKANGFKHSNNVIWIARYADVGGYCFGVTSASSSAALRGTGSFYWMWYDTLSGGLVDNGAYLDWAELTYVGHRGCMKGTLDIHGAFTP